MIYREEVVNGRHSKCDNFIRGTSIIVGLKRDEIVQIGRLTGVENCTHYTNKLRTTIVLLYFQRLALQCYYLADTMNAKSRLVFCAKTTYSKITERQIDIVLVLKT